MVATCPCQAKPAACVAQRLGSRDSIFSTHQELPSAKMSCRATRRMLDQSGYSRSVSAHSQRSELSFELHGFANARFSGNLWLDNDRPAVYLATDFSVRLKNRIGEKWNRSGAPHQLGIGVDTKHRCFSGRSAIATDNPLQPFHAFSLQCADTSTP